MKRNIGLLMLICGLALFEYGCRDNSGGGRTPRNYQVIGIQGTELLEIDSLQTEIGPLQDSAEFGRFKIKIQLIDGYVMNYAESSSSAFAYPAMPAPLEFHLDSISIRNIATSDSVDITTNFEIASNEDQSYRIPISNDPVFSKEIEYMTYGAVPFMNMYMINQPTMVSDYRILIIFYASNGDIFKAETQQFAIQP